MSEQPRATADSPADSDSKFKLFDSSISVWALVIANFIPVIGGLLFNWDIRIVLIVYWAENIVVGFYNVLKMAMARSGPNAVKFFMIPFFMVHFGGFCAGHGFFIFAFMSIEAVGGNMMGSGMEDVMKAAFDWPFFLVFIGLLVEVIKYMWATFGWSVVLPILGLFVSHGISFWQNFIGKKEYLENNVALQMFMPYGRIVLMHIAIIAAGVPIMLLGSPLPLLILLVAFKTIADLYLHAVSHHKDGFSFLTSFVQNRVGIFREAQKDRHSK